MNISIIGFGYIGAVIGAVLSDSGNNVVAIDTNKKSIENLNKGLCDIPEPALKNLVKKGVENGTLSGTLDYDSISCSEVILVTVGTPLSDQFNADLGAIRSVFFNLAKNIKSGQIVMVKSTVPPGVTRQMALEFFGERDDIYVGFSPERLAEGNAISEFNSLPIVVGGVNDDSTDKCAEFWEKVLDVDVLKVSSCEAAELVKLADNQWIDLNIALAHELAILCDSLPYNIDILEVIKGANTLKKGEHYVNILTPSIGVGGYCLTKDPWFLSALASSNKVEINLPKYGRKANDKMPLYVASSVDEFLSEKYTLHTKVKIAILGYSFKSNSGDVRFTPMRVFIKALFDLGYTNVHVYDPTVSLDSIDDERISYELSWEKCLSDASCVVYGASHDEIKKITTTQLSKLMKSGGLVYDGRRYFNRPEIDELLKHGFHYSGVGRTFNIN